MYLRITTTTKFLLIILMSLVFISNSASASISCAVVMNSGEKSTDSKSTKLKKLHDLENQQTNLKEFGDLIQKIHGRYFPSIASTTEPQPDTKFFARLSPKHFREARDLKKMALELEKIQSEINHELHKLYPEVVSSSALTEPFYKRLRKIQTDYNEMATYAEKNLGLDGMRSWSGYLEPIYDLAEIIHGHIENIKIGKHPGDLKGDSLVHLRSMSGGSEFRLEASRLLTPLMRVFWQAKLTGDKEALELATDLFNKIQQELLIFSNSSFSNGFETTTSPTHWPIHQGRNYTFELIQNVVGQLPLSRSEKDSYLKPFEETFLVAGLNKEAKKPKPNVTQEIINDYAETNKAMTANTLSGNYGLLENPNAPLTEPQIWDILDKALRYAGWAHTKAGSPYLHFSGLEALQWDIALSWLKRAPKDPQFSHKNFYEALGRIPTTLTQKLSPAQAFLIIQFFRNKTLSVGGDISIWPNLKIPTQVKPEPNSITVKEESLGEKYPIDFVSLNQQASHIRTFGEYGYFHGGRSGDAPTINAYVSKNLQLFIDRSNGIINHPFFSQKLSEIPKENLVTQDSYLAPAPVVEVIEGHEMIQAGKDLITFLEKNVDDIKRHEQDSSYVLQQKREKRGFLRLQILALQYQTQSLKSLFGVTE